MLQKSKYVPVRMQADLYEKLVWLRTRSFFGATDSDVVRQAILCSWKHELEQDAEKERRRQELVDQPAQEPTKDLDPIPGSDNGVTHANGKQLKDKSKAPKRKGKTRPKKKPANSAKK